jgi:hypothetical protein
VAVLEGGKIIEDGPPREYRVRRCAWAFRGTISFAVRDEIPFGVIPICSMR